MKLKDFIVPVKLSNTDAHGNLDSSLDTEDLISLDSFYDIGAFGERNVDLTTSATDWALACGLEADFDSQTLSGKKGSVDYWLRTSQGSQWCDTISCAGLISFNNVFTEQVGVCPVMFLNPQAVVSAKKKYRDIFKIATVKDPKGEELYHTIEFGMYPKTFVGSIANEEIERAYEIGIARPTGKTYASFCTEYKYNEQKYVRVLSLVAEKTYRYTDGTRLFDVDTASWFKVEPITWKIRNWEAMPKEINPKGDGLAKTIALKSEEAIVSLPFYPNARDKNSSLWQNSLIRGYLNGINVNDIKENGNPDFSAPNGGDFSEQSFLTEALSNELFLTIANPAEENIEKANKREGRKGYGVKVLEKPMSVNEQIKFYIENGKSFMLHGPSGIGKTRRIEEAAPDFVSIVLRNGILPEEIIGKTIYPNNDKTKEGFWVKPAWYVQLCKKCEQEPDKNHVLFIDEITNVKPSEQSLVFHLVLNNSIGPNVGKLPKNVVVVAAGNSKEESESAYNMPEPLFRRFEGHIELKPDVASWLEWGSQPSDKGDGRLKIHPLVASFVGACGSQVFYSAYDSETPPKFAIDPRGWEQVSDIIYDNKGVIVKELVANKVGKEIATSFVEFAQNPPLMIEDILEKNYDYSDIPDTVDAKYALALSLRNAKIEEIEKVRRFINNELGREILSMFDVAWVGDDDEKAIYLASLPKLEETKANETEPSYLQDCGVELPF